MISRRERSKLDKSTRIYAAARELFYTKGFDAVTTREIAELADVGLGTLSLRVGDKGALLVAIVNADLAAISDAAIRDTGSDMDIVERAIAFLRGRYEYWARNPSLARSALREMSARDDRSDAPGNQRRTQLSGRIVAMFRARNATLPAHERDDPEAFAALFTAIYLGAIRLWLHDEVLDADQGVAHLRSLLTLAARGLARPPAPRAPVTRPKRNGRKHAG
jgi:AcrR family transcriptional regulator